MACGKDKDPSTKEFIEFLDSKKFEVEVRRTYDITGMSAARVIAIFKAIVNREGKCAYREGTVFTFNIGSPPEISFTLEANPTDDQPGNGVIKRNGKKGSTYPEITQQLKHQYGKDTKTFAEDMKRVFKDNSELLGRRNEVIRDVYILLLFEIGRRLVEDGENSTDRKKALDNLSIIATVTRILKLFESTKECSFEDFFSKTGKFHCFSDDPEYWWSTKKREDAIDRLKKLCKVELKDIKALFCGEKDEQSSEKASSEGKLSSEDAASEGEASPEDAASEGEESSSSDAASKDKESSEDAKFRELPKDFRGLKLSDSQPEKSKKPSKKD